ncbi:amino acid adenylation domain-containing protein [Streptomyces sp. NPDC087917]|uniref:non-ribosomal peptide synthetase n=1 Tax=Streptomyces sp. NPDC087917 TaxID=3155060 RepID=UPI00342E8B09
MGTHETTDLEATGARFWSTVLTAGGFTAVPRWSTAPTPGTAEHETEIPADLATALRRLARGLGVTLSSALLSGHLKVLGALSGEPVVGCGYVAVPGGSPLPCRLTTDSPSCRALLLAVHRNETRMVAHHDFPVDVLRAELGLPATAPEAVFDPYGSDAPADSGTALRVTVTTGAGRYLLRIRHRTDVLDADCAARIAGYHLTALALMVADPDAAPGPQTLVGAAELHHQMFGLAGPRRDLPDARAHELFERQARTRPDAVAAVQGEREWTYRELNARANRLAHALLSRGLRREDAVAVVSERNLGWMAAVLAVCKAGGAYLPIEPRFPSDRVTAMLTRASCRFALTESGSTGALDRSLDALAEIRLVPIDAAHDEVRDAGDPRVPVPADSLAYIYFTSGTTGEPKGVMCEHAGMLNHLYAKIDDLGIGEGRTVAQTAPQCFDISLWQLLAGPIAGGRTLIVEQETVLDVERLLDTVVAGRVNVLQVVPSYLDALLSSLERRPRDLPDLRCVSVTGEILRKELVERCFASLPGIRLVNAYGLTETSDDTHHEVMDRVPDADRIALGRPVGNARVHLLGRDLEPVPLGAPGEIVFSGVCVGRGCVNDPERTRAAFGTDPYRPPGRLYRSGDHGRYLPNGKLEFLGRRDDQVKIRGFRIELGEITGALLRVRGVHEAAVIAARQTDGPRLAAFYTGPASLDADVLRDLLSASLPAYMLPASFHRIERLPMTANGKTDTKALHALAAAYDRVRNGHRPPGTPAERRVAAVWARVLGTPLDRIGRLDRFFDLGGTSLSALRVVVALDREISFKDLTRQPCLADLARLIESRFPRPDTA